MEHDFIAETEEAVIPEVLHGPNLKGLGSMTRKQFTQGILNVYHALGGDMWLRQQAKLDPKSFMEMLKKLIPTNVNLDQIDGFQITLVERYGSKMEIGTANKDLPRATKSDPASGERSPAGPEVSITETFGPVPTSEPRLLPGNSPEFGASPGLKAFDAAKDNFDFTVDE